MNRLALMSLLVLSSTACTGLEAYDVVPHAGTWTFFEEEIRSDDCAVSVDDDSLAVTTTISTITISEYADSGFFLTVDESEEAWCYMEGPQFSCERAMGSEHRGSATVTYTTVAEGWVEDPRYLDGDFKLALGCRGPDCEDVREANNVEELPCEVRGTFWAEAELGGR